MPPLLPKRSSKRGFHPISNYLIIDNDRVILLNIFMGKLLCSRDILLLGLAGVLDVFDEMKDPLCVMSKGYESMYGWVPKKFNRNNFYHLTWRSMRTGYIEKVEKNGEAYLRLTSQGQKKLRRDFPLLTMQQRPWDKKWRVVMFDIKETNRVTRDNFRQKLRELGFGMLQESVFISPHNVAEDIAEFIESIGLENAAYVFETQKLIVGDQKQLASKVWRLGVMNEEYEALIEMIKNEYLKFQNDRGKKLKKGVVEGLRGEYVQIILRDPFLPKELLPENWKGNTARELIKKFG